jgi:Activator of Hsp90 ATPase homolog 1-like protein
MENQHYTASIEVVSTPQEVFNHINNVSQWWAKSASKSASGMQTEFEGQSTKLNDEFIMRSGDRHFSKQKLIEVIPLKKVVWLVTDSKLNWIEKDKTEWTNTRMVFEITKKGDKTVLHFTHEGLVPQKECYSACSQGWNFFIKDRLFNLIIHGELK